MIIKVIFEQVSKIFWCFMLAAIGNSSVIAIKLWLGEVTLHNVD